MLKCQAFTQYLTPRVIVCYDNSMSENILNNLRPLLVGGEGAPDYAPEGLLALKRLSVERFAKSIRVTRTAIYNYINGKNRPTTPILKRMSEELELPFEELLKFCTPAGVGRPPMKD